MKKLVEYSRANKEEGELPVGKVVVELDMLITTNSKIVNYLRKQIIDKILLINFPLLKRNNADNIKEIEPEFLSLLILIGSGSLNLLNDGKYKFSKN